jgi:hypothetical protein
VDRCALFVDAGYVLTDGAMAAHGTNQREAVSWDYAGLLQFLAGLAVDRTGLPLLRCYWYEATVDGRRTPDHDTLADLPGLSLRLGRMRPGKREGVDTEIHRDLTTLARNRAVSDVLLVTAGDDLAQVIADVQDLGVRVIIVHISVDGNWTVSRPLRQQCDDIVEIHGGQLRPYAELTGGEPARYSEQYAASVYGGRPMSNGHAASVAGGGYPSLPGGSVGAHPAPPAIYTAPVVAEYQQPPAAPVRREPVRREPPPEPAAPAVDNAPPEPQSRGAHESTGPQSLVSPPNRAIIGRPALPQQALPQQALPQQAQPQPPPRPQPNHQSPPLYAAPPAPLPPPAPPALPPVPQTPVTFHEPSVPVPPLAPEAPAPQAQPPGPGQAGSGPPAAAPDQRPSAPRSPYEGGTSTSSFMDPPGGQFSPAPPGQFSGAPTTLPSRRVPQSPGQHSSQSSGPHTPGPHTPGPHTPGPHTPGQHAPGQHSSQPPAPARGQQGQRPAAAATAGYVPPQTPYGAASRPVASPSAAPPAGGSLDDTVTAAHAEGFDFGESVARDAPGLWLEAVLARKPRMPTDLEARLLQGSALPIDSLLHDEVRQALRSGFWDALERSRR